MKNESFIILVFPKLSAQVFSALFGVKFVKAREGISLQILCIAVSDRIGQQVSEPDHVILIVILLPGTVIPIIPPYGLFTLRGIKYQKRRGTVDIPDDCRQVLSSAAFSHQMIMVVQDHPLMQS